MWGLEYALLFGAEKLELDDGQTRCAFPFRSREQAELHFEDWIDTLCRWKGISERPKTLVEARRWRVEAEGFNLELYPRPIELLVPVGAEPFMEFHSTFWQRDLWPDQPSGYESGPESLYRHSDLRMNLWQLFRDFCKRHGGQHSSRVDISLSDTAAVSPDCYYYAHPSKESMIEKDYFRGPPDLIAEVLSPATRSLDRGGPRQGVYARAGVRELWLLEPLLETVEIYLLLDKQYELVAVHRAGEEFEPRLFPGEKINVTALFDDQWKRYGSSPKRQHELIPEWLLPRDMPLGLEHLFRLGHPEQRCEIWNSRAPCMLAFGSSTEAAFRFPRFVVEAGRWEKMEGAKAARIGDDEEQAEIGRFRLTRRGRQVNLDVAVDGRKYRDLLHVWADRAAWDWGEKHS